MPTKICQNCKTENHVRRLACTKCGTAFQHKPKKDSKQLNKDIELGDWINHTDKGMPKVEESPPLKDMIDNEEIKNLIAYEGFGYCISEYIDPKYIKDDKLKKMWLECKKIMREIKKYLYE